MRLKIYKYDSSHEEWKEFIKEKASGRTLQIDEAMFSYWLEILPPVYMGELKQIDILNNGIVENVQCSFGFVEGYDYITDFWRRNGQFYCKQSNVFHMK